MKTEGWSGSPVDVDALRIRRPWRRMWSAGAITLALFAASGFVAAPLALRYLAEQQLGQRIGRKVTVERVRVNPFALSFTVEGLAVLEAEGGTPFLTVGRLHVNAELASLFRRALVVREIRLESPRVRIERRLAPAGTWTGGAVYNFSDIMARLARGPKTAAADESALPRFSLNNIRVIDGTLVFDDLPLRGHHEISNISLGVPFLSTLLVDVDTFVAPGLSGRVDGTPFALQGRSRLFRDTLETVVQLRLNALDLTRYLPYLPLPVPVTVSSALLTVALDIWFVRPRDAAPWLSLKGTLALSNVSVREVEAGGRPLITLQHAGVTVADADISARRFVVDQIVLSGLDVFARRRANGKLALADLLLEGTQEPKPTRFASPPSNNEEQTRFSVGEIRLEGASLFFRDESVRPPFEARVEDIAASVRHLSNARGAQATTEVALRASPGGMVAQRGRLGLNPLAASGTIAVGGIDPERFAPYYQQKLAFEIAKGRLNLGTGYEVAERGGKVSVHLRDGFAEVHDLALRWPRPRRDLLRVPGFMVRGVDLDFDGRAVSVAQVTSRGGRLQARRDSQGAVDLATLADLPSSAVEAHLPAAPPWAITLARVDIDEWGIRFEDRAVDPPAVIAIHPLSLHATSLSTVPGSDGNVDLRLGLNKKGRLAAAGSIRFDPLAADFRLDLRTVEIVPLQAYFRDRVNMVVTSGLVSFNGQARIEHQLPEPQVFLAGDVDVTGFGAGDGEKKEQLLRSRSLRVSGLTVSTPPVNVAIREVALADFGAWLIVSPDGRFNLQEALGSPTSASLTGPAPSPPKIAVGRLKFERGEVRFIDRLIRPSYSMQLTELTGHVSGLSSRRGTRAEVDMHGRLDSSGLLAVTGRINPLEKDLFVDLKAEVKDVELPPASPYAAKYVGYGIRKGKLSLEADYQIAKRKLDARNHVVLDQLTFDDKVRSPDAVKLPVRLAVALLKDRHGVIDVDLPISGSLDDPHFKVWPLVWKVVRNLLIKATTAPFSLIARAFGDGDELSYVEFLPGVASLDARGWGRLRGLATALQQRQELSLEIQGGTDLDRDREGLRRDRLEQKLKAGKLAEIYKAETFPKPRTILGLARSLPPAEMEALILANIKVDDDDLRALALRRASVVKAALVRLAPTDAARLFLVAPRLGGAATVDFKLKTD